MTNKIHFTNVILGRTVVVVANSSPISYHDYMAITSSSGFKGDPYVPDVAGRDVLRKELTPERTLACERVLRVLIEIPTYGTPIQARDTANDALRAVQLSFHARTRGWLIVADEGYDQALELDPKQT